MEQINAVQTDSGFENIFADYPDVVGADEIAKMLGIPIMILQQVSLTSIISLNSSKM